MHRAIRKRLEDMKTHPILQDIALDGITKHLEDRQPDPYRYPEEYHMLVQAQNSIGWDNFLKGRFSKLWSHHQQQHIQRTSEVTNRNNGTTWATNLATTLLAQWHKLWTLRNEEKHGKDWEQQTKAKHEQIRREVTQLYENAAEAPPEHLDSIYTCDLDTQLQKQPAELAAWLANWMPLYEQHTQQQRRSQRQQATQAHQVT